MCRVSALAPARSKAKAVSASQLVPGARRTRTLGVGHREGSGVRGQGARRLRLRNGTPGEFTSASANTRRAPKYSRCLPSGAETAEAGKGRCMPATRVLAAATRRNNASPGGDGLLGVGIEN